MTPAGIEPATFRLVARHLNHCTTCGQLWCCIHVCNSGCVGDRLTMSAYALLILNCKHEYGTITDHVNKPPLLLSYEQMYIQLFYPNNQFIPEQHPNEQNPMFQQLHNRHHHMSHPTWHLNQHLHLNPAQPVSFHPAYQTVIHTGTICQHINYNFYCIFCSSFSY